MGRRGMGWIEERNEDKGRRERTQGKGGNEKEGRDVKRNEEQEEEQEEQQIMEKERDGKERIKIIRIKTGFQVLNGLFGKVHISITYASSSESRTAVFLPLV